MNDSQAVIKRQYVYTQIHEIVRHGGGGYIYSDVWNMPVHIREFTFKQLLEESKKSNKKEGEFTADDVAQGKVFKPQKELPEGTFKTKPKTKTSK